MGRMFDDILEAVQALLMIPHAMFVIVWAWLPAPVAEVFSQVAYYLPAPNAPLIIVGFFLVAIFAWLVLK